MENKFNLLDEPWINVRSLEGAAVPLGIRAILLRAHELRAIEDASPLVVASLYRLLLAVLHRALKGPTGLRQLRRWLEQGRFETDQLEPYLKQWEHRFWLFSNEPFFQVADLELKSSSIAKLAAECSSGNNKALFDHSVDSRPPQLGYAESARWLVAHQAFSLCGGVSGGGLINFTDSISPRGALVFVQGKDLYQTLLANLAIYPEDTQGLDTAVWEHKPPTLEQLKKKQVSSVSGFANLYTWPSRAIRLLDDGDGVSLIHYASGLQAKTWFRDPMLAYEKPRTGKGENISVKFSLERAFWRDFDTLVPPDADLRPLVLNQGEELQGYLAMNGTLRVFLLGQIARPGTPTVDAWRSENYPLPLRILQDEARRAKILTATQLAKYVAEGPDGRRGGLRIAGFVMASEVADGEAAGQVCDSLPLMEPYWAELETLFSRFLTRLGEVSNPEEAYLFWREAVIKTAWKAFGLAAKAIKGNGSGALERKAVLAGENRLFRELRGLKLLEEVKA